jgi:hypothetical protein
VMRDQGYPMLAYDECELCRQFHAEHIHAEFRDDLARLDSLMAGLSRLAPPPPRNRAERRLARRSR